MENYSTSEHSSDIRDIEDDIKQACLPLYDIKHLDPLIDQIGDHKVVMLGEASHGTHEYYTWRMLLTQRLIKEKQFSFVAIEGDWPDCYCLNRYIKGYPEAGRSAQEVILKSYNRWPTWIWGNWETVALAEWLKDYNLHRSANRRAGFYGLDVYSLWESMDAIINYLVKKDPEAVEMVKKAMRCFEPYTDDEGETYGRAAAFIPESCRNEVMELLSGIRKNIPFYDSDKESVFNLEQNALVVKNAESYYQAMVKGGVESWNLRDYHMTETLERLRNFHGEHTKCIVWAHNSHIGDARASNLVKKQMINIGQLAREKFGKQNVFQVGFGSYTGTVMAATRWGAPMKEMDLPVAESGSWEETLHRLEEGNRLVLLQKLQEYRNLNSEYPHRAVGVVYHPSAEHQGNYVSSIMPVCYDAFIYLDKTTALHALHRIPDGKQVPETYPWGM